MASWSERLYQSLSLSAALSLRIGGAGGGGVIGRQRRRQARRLLRRVLQAGDRFGFETPPAAAAYAAPAPQAVLVAWSGRPGHLSPDGLRAALVGNFVLLVNRAFGHSAEALASVAPEASNADADWGRRRLLADIGLMGLQRCRLEAEDCYARETHRLARVLRGLALPGSESWCDRRLRDLLAALARAEATECQRLHWVAGADEAERLHELEAALRALGYAGLASPAPWRLHVHVGPVLLAGGAGAGRRRGVSHPSPEDLLRRCGSRDGLLLRLLSPPRARPVKLPPPVPGRAPQPQQLALALHRCRQRLARLPSVPLDTVWHDEATTGHGLAHRGQEEEEDEDWNRLEAALAGHLADFPAAVAAAYLTYEPGHLVRHLEGQVRLMEAILRRLDGRRVPAGTAASAAVAVAAGRAVLGSTCGVLGLRRGCETGHE